MPALLVQLGAAGDTDPLSRPLFAIILDLVPNPFLGAGTTNKKITSDVIFLLVVPAPKKVSRLRRGRGGV